MSIFYVGFGFHDDIVYVSLANLLNKGELRIPSLSNMYIFTLRPTVYYPIALSYKLFGINEYSASLPFMIFSIGIVITTYLIGKTIFNDHVGLISSFILTIFPLFVFYSTQYGPDIPLAFFSSLSVLFFIKGEKNLKQNKKFYFLSGVFLGFAYLTKITFVVLGFVYIVYTVGKTVLDRKIHYEYLMLVLGFIVVFIPENIYYFIKTSQWLLNLRANFITYYKPLNPNHDRFFYLKAMFNVITVDDFYFFGMFSYLLIMSVFYMMLNCRKESFYLLVWLILPYILLEIIFPYLTSVKSIEKDVRFLIFLLIPEVIIIGKFLESILKSSRFLFSIILLLLFITSLYFSFDATKYVRTAMGDIREVYNFIKYLPQKTIYTNIGSGDKLRFFFKFDADIQFYNCGVINCNLSVYNRGTYIEDAYIILYPDADPLFRRKNYPRFVFDPPKNWKLLKVIDLEPPIKHNYLHIKSYNPQIYYAPKNISNL